MRFSVRKGQAGGLACARMETLSPSEAREQAKLYARGMLGETAQRYVVVVSLQEMQLPDPVKDGEVEYRHVNIVVDPSSPSQVARRQHRKDPTD
jgi:hypothetical protein